MRWERWAWIRPTLSAWILPGRLSRNQSTTPTQTFYWREDGNRLKIPYEMESRPRAEFPKDRSLYDTCCHLSLGERSLKEYPLWLGSPATLSTLECEGQCMNCWFSTFKPLFTIIPSSLFQVFDRLLSKLRDLQKPWLYPAYRSFYKIIYPFIANQISFLQMMVSFKSFPPFPNEILSMRVQP